MNSKLSRSAISKPKLVFVVFALMLIAIPSMYLVPIKAQSSNEIQTNGRVCPNPSSPCSHTSVHFGNEDLSFRLPQNLQWQHNYYSASFYAVILKSVRAIVDNNPDTENCLKGAISERERRRVQAMFPNRKVFASRFGCYIPIVWYTNTNPSYNFLAVYAGETEAEAKGFLEQVKAAGQFPNANLRKMQVVLGFGD